MKNRNINEIKLFLIEEFTEEYYYKMIGDKMNSLVLLYDGCPDDMYDSLESFIEDYIEIEYNMFDFFHSEELFMNKYKNKDIGYAITFLAGDSF